MKYCLLKIVTLFAILFNFKQANAQESFENVSEDDLKHIQELMDKNILVKKDNEVKLNDLLKEADLIRRLDNTKGTNCGDGSCW